jgi:hypothetical protein
MTRRDPMTPARFLDATAAGTGYDVPAHPLGNVGRIDAPMLDFSNSLPPGFRRGALFSAMTAVVAMAAAARAVLARRRA